MRVISLLILVTLISCARESANDGASIIFATVPVKSPSLLVAPVLKYDPGKPHLELNVRLQNLLAEKITVKEIVVSNAAGLNSSENFAGKSISLSGNADTTFHLTLHHIHDKALYHATGLPGLVDSLYHTSVFYSVEGIDDLRVINLVSQMPAEKFVLYRKKYGTPVQTYSLDTTGDFNNRQRQYLEANMEATAPPFVHLTQNEVAIFGLNFRVKCFHKNDTLYSEVFAINHSEMTMRIDTSAMEMMPGHSLPETPASTLKIEKVTGSKAEALILRRGDRVVINMQKHMQKPPENLRLVLKSAFVLPDDKPLFIDNLELVPALKLE